MWLITGLTLKCLHSSFSSCEKIFIERIKNMMKILFFEAIVLGLSIPISIVIYQTSKSLTLWVTFLLMLLCILAIGGVRHDRRAAITTGVVVQVVIIFAGIWVRPLNFPGILFLLVWGLAVVLSKRVDEAKIAQAEALKKTL